MIEGYYIMSGINKEETMVKVLVKLANLVEEQSAKIDLQTKQIAKQQKQIEELNHYVHNNLCEEEIEKICFNAVEKATFTVEDHQDVVKLLNGSIDGIGIWADEIKALIRQTAEQTVKTVPSQMYIPTQSSQRGLF